MKIQSFMVCLVMTVSCLAIKPKIDSKTLPTTTILLTEFIKKNPTSTALNADPIELTTQTFYDENGDKNTFYYRKKNNTLTIGHKIILTSQPIIQAIPNAYKEFLIKEAYKKIDPCSVCKPTITKEGTSSFGSIACQATIDLSNKELKKWAELVQAQTLKDLKKTH